MDDFAKADAFLDAGEGDKAMPIFHRLAEQGRLDAMHSIAHTYLYGIAGIERNYDLAFEWFTKAATRGCPQAMYHLGMCNARGYGTPVNPELSAQWYARSAERGDEDAMFELGKCYETGFGVEKDMTRAKQEYARAANRGHAEAAQRLR